MEIWPKLIRLRDFVGRMITDFPARAESMATIKYYHGLKFPLITLIREITKKRKESPKHLRNGLFPYFLWIAELTAKDRTEAVPTLNFVWFIFIVSPGEKLNQGTRSRSINQWSEENWRNNKPMSKSRHTSCDWILLWELGFFFHLLQFPFFFLHPFLLVSVIWWPVLTRIKGQ